MNYPKTCSWTNLTSESSDFCTGSCRNIQTFLTFWHLNSLWLRFSSGSSRKSSRSTSHWSVLLSVPIFSYYLPSTQEKLFQYQIVTSSSHKNTPKSPIYMQIEWPQREYTHQTQFCSVTPLHSILHIILISQHITYNFRKSEFPKLWIMEYHLWRLQVIFHLSSFQNCLWSPEKIFWCQPFKCIPSQWLG